MLPSMAPPSTTTPDPCGPDEIGICEWVYDRTEDETAAKLADWLIGRPLAIITVLLSAFILQFIAKWIVRRTVRRMMVQPAAVQKRIDAIASATGDAPTEVTEVTEEIEQARRVARAESIGSALAGTIAAIIWVSALISIISIIGFEVAPLLAGAGVIGVALGFGAQSLVRDCINGIFMLIEDQYGIGDVVDLGVASGDVEHISLRTTVLRDVDGTVWHVPNGEIQRVGNLSQRWSAAILDVRVAHDADVDKAHDLLEQAAKNVCETEEWADNVLAAPRVLGVQSIDAEGVSVRLLVKTAPGQQWALQRALRQEIKRVFDKGGIAMPTQRLVAMQVDEPPSMT